MRKAGSVSRMLVLLVLLSMVMEISSLPAWSSDPLQPNHSQQKRAKVCTLEDRRPRGVCGDRLMRLLNTVCQSTGKRSKSKYLLTYLLTYLLLTYLLKSFNCPVIFVMFPAGKTSNCWNPFYQFLFCTSTCKARQPPPPRCPSNCAHVTQLLIKTRIAIPWIQDACRPYPRCMGYDLHLDWSHA